MLQFLERWKKQAPALTAPYPLDRVACHFPLWRFEILSQGQINHCCHNWMPHSIANITEVSILDAFRSEKAADIRREVQTGNFKYCEAKVCPYLSRYVNVGKIENPLHLRTESAELNKQMSLDQGRQLMLMLNYDPSCNLRCPSCRNDTILFTEENAPPRLKQIHEAVLRNIDELREAGYAITLNITGSGDAFASPLYYRLMKELRYDPRLSLELQTNGVLMEEARFTDPMYQMLKFVAVSVDGASQPVYDQVRRGGNFGRVQKNLAWLDGAIRAGRFAHNPYFKVNFIVQKENYREIVDFAKQMLAFSSIGQVWFNLIADWGHLSKEEFSAKAIWLADHPEHREFRRVLEDPILRDPRVDLGNLTSYL